MPGLKGIPKNVLKIEVLKEANGFTGIYMTCLREALFGNLPYDNRGGVCECYSGLFFVKYEEDKVSIANKFLRVAKE